MHHCVEVSSSRRTTFKTSFESQMKYAETKTTKRQHIKVSKIHLPSIVFEWIPVTGSLKWREWLTVECEYPKNTKIQNISWSKYITTFVNQTIISLPTIRNDVRARTHTAKNNFFKSFLSIIIIYTYQCNVATYIKNTTNRISFVIFAGFQEHFVSLPTRYKNGNKFRHAN